MKNPLSRTPQTVSINIAVAVRSKSVSLRLQKAWRVSHFPVGLERLVKNCKPCENRSAMGLQSGSIENLEMRLQRKTLVI